MLLWFVATSTCEHCTTTDQRLSTIGRESCRDRQFFCFLSHPSLSRPIVGVLGVELGGRPRSGLHGLRSRIGCVRIPTKHVMYLVEECTLARSEPFAFNTVQVVIESVETDVVRYVLHNNLIGCLILCIAPVGSRHLASLPT